VNGSRFTHFDLHTPVDPAKRLEYFVWTNAKLLVRVCMRYSMTQALFMPFTNTCSPIVIGRVLTNRVRTLDQARRIWSLLNVVPVLDRFYQ
jgi:hypothetical protein